MKAETFHAQLKRLRTQWPHSYGEDRERILFQMLKPVDDSVFVDAVTECLMKCRQAPLGDELNQEIERARGRERERAWRQTDGSMLGVLHHAADNNKAANPDHVAACMKLITGYLDKRYSKAQLQQGVAVLEAASGMRAMPTASGKDRSAGG